MIQTTRSSDSPEPRGGTDRRPHRDDRQPWIDLLRGIAILLMIPANLSPYFAEPHPMWYRIFGSYAAPTFIALSAALVRMRGSRHDAGYYLVRGGLVILVGMLLDFLLWGIVPWTSFDVLYIIGLAMPCIHLTRRFGARALLGIAAAFFAASWLVQHLFVYDATVYEIYLSEPEVQGFTRLMQSWFVDGWFPVFPWLGFAFAGAGIHAATIGSGRDIGSAVPAAAGMVLLAAGVLLLVVPISGIAGFANNAILSTREGYSEIFYPPTPGYIATALGTFLCLAWIARRFERARIAGIFPFFGRYSMMVYILHQVIGAKMLAPLLGAMGLETIDNGLWFTAANLAVITLIAVICLLIDRLPDTRVTRILFIRILLGR